MTPPLDAFLATRPLNTARSYRPAVTAWLAWLGKDPARATAKDAAAYAGHLSATSKPATVSSRLSALASFHRHLMDSGMARANPFEDARPPAALRHANSRVLSVAELRRLTAHLDEPEPSLSRLRERALVMFLLHTGRWPSEIAPLRWGDLNSQEGQVMLRWAGGVQALPEHVYADLVDWHVAEGWMILPGYYLWRRRQAYNNLPQLAGGLDPAGHIEPPQMTAIVGRVGRALGIDLTPGALRNTFAVLYSTVTGDPAEASRILGNRDPKSAAKLLKSPKGQAAMTEFSAALGALTAT